MTAAESNDTHLEAVVRGLYDQPQLRHAIEVTSAEEVARIRRDLESTVQRLFGSEAVWGRGIRISVERDDDGVPHRVWMWRALVGGQRTAREGFSGQARGVRS